MRAPRLPPFRFRVLIAAARSFSRRTPRVDVADGTPRTLTTPAGRRDFPARARRSIRQVYADIRDGLQQAVDSRHISFITEGDEAMVLHTHGRYFVSSLVTDFMLDSRLRDILFEFSLRACAFSSRDDTRFIILR